MPRGPLNLIQRGALQERLARGLGIQERSPAPTLAFDVQPVVMLEDLTRQSPWKQPVDRVSWVRAQSIAVAGELSRVTITSPAAGKAIYVVRRIICCAAGALQVQYGFCPTAEVTAVLARFADPRNGDSSGAEVRVGSIVATDVDRPLGLIRFSSSTLTIQIENVSIVIPPFGSTGISDAFALEGLTTNTAIDVSVELAEYTGD